MAKRKPAAGGKSGKKTAKKTKDMRVRHRPKLQERDRPKGPRSQALPGMEQVRSTKLDRICEALGEVRTRRNALSLEEKGLLQSGLQEMQKSTDKHPQGRSVYKHGGIELARIPGADTLRARLVKDQGDADQDSLQSDEESNLERLESTAGSDVSAAARESGDHIG